MSTSVVSDPSGWQRDLPASGPQPRLARDTRARVVVVGGGIAGLAVAYRLTRYLSGEDILVLEAARVGDGASGRSTGIVGPGVGGPIEALVKRYGRDGARAMFGASYQGVGALRRLVKDLPDECELTNTYQLVAAYTESHAVRLRQRAETLAGLGFDVAYLDAAQTAQRLGTGRYHGALCYPDVSTVNPWRLCQVLAGALLAAGVRIAEGTPVTAVAAGEPVLVRAGERVVRAGTVVVATDGFTRSAGLFRRAIAAVRTHVVRTGVLRPEELAATGWNGDGAVIDTRSFFNYFRLTPQRQLVFGGGRALPEERVTAAKVSAVRARIVRELGEVFPALAGVPVVDFWSGVTGSTFDRLPIVGPVAGAPGVWFTGAWCGHGLAMSAFTAEMVAPCVAGAAAWPPPDGRLPDGPLPWLRGGAGWIPSGRFGALVLNAYLSGLDTADRIATRGDRTPRR